VKHIVLFKYKPGATSGQINEVTEAFRALKGKIPGITSFECGVNNSPENLNKGFTHVYLITFENAGARNAYGASLEGAEHPSLYRAVIPFA
jgi:hypothetical protein